MKAFKIFSVVVPMAVIQGCLFPGSVRESDIAAVEAQIQSINRRLDQLEASRGITPSSSSSSATYAASTAGAYEAARAPASSAYSGAAGGGWWAAFTWRGASSKLLRGLTNVVTGWVEIPKRVNETTNQSGILPGFTWGLLRGLGYGLVRTAGGLYETVTFPFPAPPGYQPIMQPPYVFSQEAPAE